MRILRSEVGVYVESGEDRRIDEVRLWGHWDSVRGGWGQGGWWWVRGQGGQGGPRGPQHGHRAGQCDGEWDQEGVREARHLEIIMMMMRSLITGHHSDDHWPAWCSQWEPHCDVLTVRVSTGDWGAHARSYYGWKPLRALYPDPSQHFPCPDTWSAFRVSCLAHHVLMSARNKPSDLRVWLAKELYLVPGYCLIYARNGSVLHFVLGILLRQIANVNPRIR